MKIIRAIAAIAFFAVCSTVYALYDVSNRGEWPKTWPKELEPLRKQARTLEGPLHPHQHYAIPFTKREEFESAWPHLLKVKSKGAAVRLEATREGRAQGLAVSLVRAAGGVVLRRGPAGELETLLVHRPRYDDWTLPKGKLLPGEAEEDAALREVEEETGLACEIEGELASVEYTDSRGRPKRVRYYVMRPCSGSFHSHAEVAAPP